MISIGWTQLGRAHGIKVTHALALLDAYRVETNLLCVVTGQLARKPQRAFKTSASWDSTICNSSHVLTHLIRLEGRHILYAGTLWSFSVRCL